MSTNNNDVDRGQSRVRFFLFFLLIILNCYSFILVAFAENEGNEGSVNNSSSESSNSFLTNEGNEDGNGNGNGNETEVENENDSDSDRNESDNSEPDNSNSAENTNSTEAVEGGQNDPLNLNLPSSYTSLLPYVLSSPDQHQGEFGKNTYINAGSCLFMAITGAMEILLNMDHPEEKRVSDGDTDISERWTMNVGDWVYKNNLFVDKLLLFNHYQGALLNRDYRFTKGIYGRRYSVKVNWLNDLPDKWREQLVATPKIERQLLFGKKSVRSRLDVAVMNDKNISDIKRALVEKQGPVLVVYNDSGVWHTVLIVGYDDNKAHEFGKELAVSDDDKASTTNGRDEDLKRDGCTLVRSIKKKLTRRQIRKVNSAMKKGGCGDKGVFYVRESEYYPDGFYKKSEKSYDYDPKREGEEQAYPAPYVTRSYEWLKYLGNHAVSIYRPDVNQAKFPPAAKTSFTDQ